MAVIPISGLPNANLPADGDELLAAVQSGVTVNIASKDLGFLQAGANAQPRSVQSKLRERVSVKDFGALCDGSTDDTVAVQRCIDYCATFDQWPTMVIPGKCKITASLIVNRQVNTETTEWCVYGEGPGAGIYTTANVTVFDTTLTYDGVNPVSEMIKFENVHFETSSVFNNSYVLSEKFLRIKFFNCSFYIMRVVASNTYVQTLYFEGCDIQNNPASFIACAGLYDVLFSGCTIYNGSRLIYCVDAARGTNGLRLIGNLIENIYGNSIVSCTGATGVSIIGNHLESNYSPEFNFFAGGIQNKSILVQGNYIFNPNGPTMYYGPTDRVTSSGNAVTPNLFHQNVIQCTNLFSIGDYAPGGRTDGTNVQSINGMYRTGSTATTTWSDTTNQFAKDTSGRFGIGYGIQPDVRLAVAGSDQTDANFAGVFYDSNGNVIIGMRNDRLIWMPALGDYADDAAAAAAGVDIGFLYRTGSVVKIRVT